MDEIVPVILGAVFGTVIWLSTSGRKRLAFSMIAITFAAAAAMIASGEYLASWVYLLLDLGEATAGVAAGCFVAERFLAPRTARTETKAQR